MLTQYRKYALVQALNVKLKTTREAPPNGGFYFITEDKERISSPTDLRRLVQLVADNYQANGKQIPSDLAQIIEDQICARIPASFCWKGWGDIVANAIQLTAGAVDAVAGTKLQQSAKSCGSCAKRKRALNRL